MPGLEPGTLRFSAQYSITALVCEELNLMTDIVRWNQTQEDGLSVDGKDVQRLMAAAEPGAVWHSYVLLMNSFEGVEVMSAAGWTQTWQNVVPGVFGDNYAALQIIIANYSALLDRRICGKVTWDGIHFNRLV